MRLTTALSGHVCQPLAVARANIVQEQMESWTPVSFLAREAVHTGAAWAYE
jgi:hypothetical protein